ncbi:hypothetical protein AKJ45_00090 [candidate division MSBL1 archaeon SCGC-AAA261F19]|uniref:Ribonuclease Z n=2 Tax=candidate division MSBL1 TaxID=215777 RepID=A0A133VBV6_9EURY|nr:hypothetical protein AKJ43_01975 [candidate division MSBL1 archaeon SCGC-AAA261D19]KXB03905.1 hypothetical protein AKJ45_00090 [candidate division MSBL1 archaeon SCGC-AAA261F19]
MPTAERGLAAVAIKRHGELLLFDCGEGTQRQMVRAGLSIMKIDSVFITHFHGDHFLGVPGLVQTMSLLDREKELEIYGPEGIEEKIETLLRIPHFTLKFGVKIHDIDPDEEIRRSGYRIKTCKTDHASPGIAYALIEDERPGKFYPKKAKGFGIEPGPSYSRLQNGECIKLPDGKVVKPEQVMGPPRPGRKIVYADDTRPSKQIVQISQGADLLIHDGTFAGELQEIAAEAGHSTVEEAAKIAKEAGVRQLVLTHISPRHTNSSKLEKQAQGIFPDTVIAHDLMELEVKPKN